VRIGDPEGGWPSPFRPVPAARLCYGLHAFLAPRRLHRWLAAWIERHPRVRRAFTAGEKVTKEQLFGCRMCGQCALPATGYACPMTCPKQLRNGPCGGVSPDGQCEVYPGMRCVWVTAVERAEQSGRAADLSLLHRPVDHRETRRSSWVNYWQGRDEGLWADVTEAGRPAMPPELNLGPR
jgi:hypothetical protein